MGNLSNVKLTTSPLFEKGSMSSFFFPSVFSVSFSYSAFNNLFIINLIICAILSLSFTLGFWAYVGVSSVPTLLLLS